MAGSVKEKACRLRRKWRFMLDLSADTRLGRVWQGRIGDIPCDMGKTAMFADWRSLQDCRSITVLRKQTGSVYLTKLNYPPPMPATSAENRNLAFLETLAGDMIWENIKPRTLPQIQAAETTAAILGWLREQAADTGEWHGTIWDIPQAGLSVRSLYRHLRILENLGLVERTKIGGGYIYRWEIR